MTGNERVTGNKIEVRLLGYDAREGEEDNTPLRRNVREEFLLRPEIECPLSVDTLLWPTRFHYPDENALDRDVRFNIPVPSVDPRLVRANPDYCERGMWLSLARMRECLGAACDRSVLLAVELVAPDADFQEHPSSWDYPREASALPEGSVQLGYDIADAAPLSGLSNCMYTPGELAELRPVWAERINEHGLLTAEADAIEFCAIANQRVRGHAPFWVYRLYRVL